MPADETRTNEPGDPGEALEAETGSKIRPAPFEPLSEDLPIVARLVVEIRSDGTRTIARGAIEDSLNDQQVAVEAHADSPLELSRALAKLLFSAPFTGLLDRAKPAGSDRRPRGVRAQLGALGRKLGDRLDRGARGRSDEPGDD